MTHSSLTTERRADIEALLTPVPATARKRIVVAMSGGVDSSVVAAMLHAQGHDVVGITLQLYDHGKAIQNARSCCAGQDIHDARRVAELSGFPHYVLDYESRFRQAVIDQFADSYLAGETPIPCIQCNQQVKFKDLLETARELGADRLATGHYVVRRETPDGPALHRAHDTARDQSYFLFATTREQLDLLSFPLGDLPKPVVRELAARLDLPVASKSDSQDICFVPNGRYAETIERLKPGAARPGDIVHVDGRVLGRHDGIIKFTVGQRKGLGIATGDPLFVVRLDAATSRVVVGPREALETARLRLRDVNWIGPETLPDAVTGAGTAILARVRSTQEPEPARLTAGTDGSIEVVLQTPAHGVARGQACVFYDSAGSQARVLGGGWIAGTNVTDAVNG